MTTTSERDGLMRSILEQPDEDAPRLILADWYEENGDPDRAEVIRLEIRRARLDDRDPEAWLLDRRIGNLADKHSERWMAELPHWEGVALCGSERGLPSLASVKSVCAWAEHEDAALAVAPINTLSIQLYTCEDEPVGPTLRRCRHLHRIRRLRLRGGFVPDDLALPDFPDLRELDFDETSQEDYLLEALGRCRHWPHFERLRIERGYFTPAGWRALASTPIFSTLRELDLNRCGLHRGLMILLESPHRPNLRTLRLSEEDLNDGAVQAILEHDWPELAHLDLSANDGLNDTTVGALAGKHWPRLRSLDLGISDLGDSGLAALAQSDRLPSLRSLVLGACRYTREGLKALLAAPWLPELVELDLWNFKADGDAVQALASAPLTGLRNLNLRECNLDDAAIRHLLEAPWLPGLLKLDLG
jgi:uncharacterized protein (TIGR02996 family)